MQGWTSWPPGQDVGLCCFPRRDLHSPIPRTSRLQTRCRAGMAGHIPPALGEVLSTKWGLSGKVVMGPFSELHGLKKPVWGFLGPCEFGGVVCLQPWETPHVRLCADAADNTSLDVWDISPEQTPRKGKLVKSQLLPGRDGRVTKSISPRCLGSPVLPRSPRQRLCPPGFSPCGLLHGSPALVSAP